MGKLRICFTSNSSPWTKFHGGGQVFVHNIAEQLARMGHLVTVLYTGPRDRRLLAPRVCSYNREWALYLGYPFTAKLRQLNSLTVYYKLLQLDKKYDFQIVNALGGEALLIPKFCRDRGTYFFFSVEHPELGAIRPQLLRDRPVENVLALLRTRELAICRYACRRSDGVFTPSSFTKNEAIRHFGLNPAVIRVVYHGIIGDMLAKPTDGIDRDDRGPILFFGRLEPQKGVDVLIRAYYELLKRRAIAEQDLILIGTGPSERRYRRLVSNLGIAERVFFRGWRSAEYIKEQLAAASLCVLPSRSESFGLTMAETLSQGVPLVTTSAGSIPEVVDYGRGGWLAEPNDVESLSLTIREALEGYEMGAAKAKHGEDYVRSRFSWKKAAIDYERFYVERLR